jgi:transposase-like protein
MGKEKYPAKFKADRVVEVIQGLQELGAIAAHHKINPNMLRTWKRHFLERAPSLFEESKQDRELAARLAEFEEERDELLKTVGQLTLERDWLKKKSVDICGSEYEKKFNK